MAFVPIDSLPDGARVWIFGADRALRPEEERHVREELGAFLERWTAHRRELAAGLDVRHGRFVVVALDESRVPASGCSIDALVRWLRELEGALRVTLTDASPVWYRDEEGQVARATRTEFRALARSGRVGEATPVFDLTADSLAPLRSAATDGWERPAADSWHARLLRPIGSAAGGDPPGRGTDAG